MDISKIPIADGHFESMTYTDQILQITFIDWQGKKWILEFQNTFAFEAIAPNGTDIAELIIEENNDWVDKLKYVLEEDLHEIKCFRFLSSWTNNCVCQIAAKECIVAPVLPAPPEK